MMVKYSRRKSLETTQQIFAGLARFYCWRAAHSSVIWESRLLLIMYTFCASTANHMWCLIHSGVIWQCSFSDHICLHFSSDFSPPAPLPLLSLPSSSLSSPHFLLSSSPIHSSPPPLSPLLLPSFFHTPMQGQRSEASVPGGTHSNPLCHLWVIDGLPLHIEFKIMAATLVTSVVLH